MTATAIGAPPRFRHVPLFASSAGQDCIDLAAHAGLHLYDWQQDVVKDALGQRADGRWAASEVDLIVPRQNGKGAVLEAVELFFLFLEPSCRLITHTAHRFDTCLDHFRRLRPLIEETPDLLALVSDRGRQRSDGLPSGIKDSNGKESIELRDGSRLNFKAREKGSGRGFSGDLVVFDEAFYLGDLTGLVSTMSARVNPQVWFTSSAPLPRSESNALRSIVRQGRRLATGEIEEGAAGKSAYFEWSCEADADIDDPAALAGSNPSLDMINADVLEVERRRYSRDELARERFGIFPDDDDALWELFAEADWAAGHTDLIPDWMGGPVAFGVEITPARSAASISAAGLHPSDRVAVELIEHRPGTDWVLGRIVELLAAHPSKGVVLDPRSAARTLVDPLRDRHVEAVEVNSSEYAGACETFFDLVRGQQVAHHGQEELTAAVAGATKRKHGDGWLFARDGRDVTPLSSATLAVRGFQQIPTDTSSVYEQRAMVSL